MTERTPAQHYAVAEALLAEIAGRRPRGEAVVIAARALVHATLAMVPLRVAEAAYAVWDDDDADPGPAAVADR